MMKVLLFLLLLAVAAGVAAKVFQARADDWWSASREPLGIAPDPATTPEAVVQVYAARTYGWRGAFGVHTWIAVKPGNAPAYTIYEVIGWRHYRGHSALAVHQQAPDRRWFGNDPEVVAQARGAGVDDLIRRIHDAAMAYPFADTYRVWPGPNSNTFTAHVLRAVPELRADLPPTAIGKDYLTGGLPVARTTSGTGFQFSVLGLLGIAAGIEEGVEVNILGLTFGIDPLDLTLKMPGVGRLGV
ncbi:MAG: DUF3750 domain-containing protein [Hyphomicrobiales bacterium]|nr:DUF3750 domain-containing protein [Hyphomicrobiales bacterium]MCP5371198.1 DUF3750 domain-containing protein [Hyphomicrobiales bacterium]